MSSKSNHQATSERLASLRGTTVWEFTHPSTTTVCDVMSFVGSHLESGERVCIVIPESYAYGEDSEGHRMILWDNLEELQAHYRGPYVHEDVFATLRWDYDTEDNIHMDFYRCP